MKNNKGFVATGLLIALLVLMLYIISNVIVFNIKAKYTRVTRIEKTNMMLDDSKNSYKRMISRIHYTK